MPKAKVKVKDEAAPAAQPVERFYRIVELPRRQDEANQGYQPELIEVQGDRVVSRQMVSKPNLFEYVQGDMLEMMDPRNNVQPNNSPVT